MHQVLIPAPVEKALQRIRNRADRDRLISAIETLASDPRPPGCIKLKGFEDLYRVRNRQLADRLPDPRQGIDRRGC